MCNEGQHGITPRDAVSSPPLRDVRLLPAIASTGVGLALYLWSQLGVFWAQPGATLRTFRRYFSFDQLSYLAIVVNGSHGNFAPVEPFTGSGTNHYPRGYYLLLGLIARLTSADVTLIWNVVALMVQALLVITLAVTCILLTRRAWTGVLAALPFLVGTFSTLVDGDWSTELDSHAVLWGAYGVMFTANGESAALSVSGTCLLLLLLVAAGRIGRGVALPVSIVACGLIGLLANVQTYAFLTATFLLAFACAAIGLVRRPRAIPIALTAILMLAVVAVGPGIAEGVGPLAALAFGAVPAMPGLVAFGAQTRWRALWCGAVLAVFAAPQAVGTVLGVAAGDAFLVYREASSSDLGIPAGPGLRAALVPLLGLAVVVIVSVRRRLPTQLGLALGAASAWALLAANDRWGANQEPYRFWIDMFTLVCVLLVPVLGWVTVSPAAATWPWDRDAPDGHPARGRAAHRAPHRAWQLAATLIILIGVAVMSAADYLGFRREVSRWPVIDMTTDRAEAIGAAAGGTSGGIVLPDPCIDPFTLKTVWGGQTAFYNLGLAWPDNRDALEATLDARRRGILDLDAAREAGVVWVLIDSACSVQWAHGLDEGTLEVAGDAPYSDGVIRFVRLIPEPA